MPKRTSVASPSSRGALHAPYGLASGMADTTKNSLVNNINKKKKADTSRPKAKSTVSKDSYGEMKHGWSSSKKSAKKTAKKATKTTAKKAAKKTAKTGSKKTAKKTAKT